MSALAPCPSCSRHVRVAERQCPFCATALALDPAPRPMPAQRLGRAATFAFGAAIATSAVGCGTATTPGNTDAGGGGNDAFVATADAGTDGGLVAAYGGPMIDAAVDDSGLVAAYGGPPIDAGVDTGPNVALYGAPPPPPEPQP